MLRQTTLVGALVRRSRLSRAGPHNRGVPPAAIRRLRGLLLRRIFPSPKGSGLLPYIGFGVSWREIPNFWRRMRGITILIVMLVTLSAMARPHAPQFVPQATGPMPPVNVP
jgi:hypothetical protein